MYKVCKECNELKLVSEFYASFNKCKVCICVERKKHRDVNLDRIRQEDRRRRRKANLTDEQWSERLELSRRYAKENPDIVRKIKLKYVESNPVKRSAHVLVGNAIRDGKLFKQPCEVCGDIKVHGHHCDYNKPLEVMWLCAEHHSQWHSENGEGLNSDVITK